MSAHFSFSLTAEADSLTITDNRTGKTVCVPIIEKQAVPSLPLWKEFKLRSYDPGYMNTAVCRYASPNREDDE